MNVASAWKLPVIFVNEMNCWASTTPYRTTCNVENISDRAAGYHVPGVVVDGQDPFAVYEATKEAVERARAGEGPTFIEAKTYRIEGHFVGDPELYRKRKKPNRFSVIPIPSRSSVRRWLRQALWQLKNVTQ